MIKYLALYEVDTHVTGAYNNEEVYEDFTRNHPVTVPGIFFEVTNLKEGKPIMMFSFSGEIDLPKEEAMEQIKRIDKWLHSHYTVIDFTEKIVEK